MFREDVLKDQQNFNNKSSSYLNDITSVVSGSIKKSALGGSFGDADRNQVNVIRVRISKPLDVTSGVTFNDLSKQYHNNSR